jgi:hypothetical protein
MSSAHYPKYMIDNNYYKGNIYEGVAFYGFIDCLKYLYQNSSPHDPKIYELVSLSGNLESVKWLDQLGCPRPNMKKLLKNLLTTLIEPSDYHLDNSHKYREDNKKIKKIIYYLYKK